MNIISLLVCCLTVALVACEEKPVQDSNDLIGDIWSNCGNSGDMSVIKNVTITPNPPSKDKPVTIDAFFTLKENITGGSFTAKVKYSIFPTITQTIKVCDLAEKAGLKCPVSKNTTHIVITEKIPSLVPGGHYKGQVIGVDQNGKRIGCINFDLHI